MRYSVRRAENEVDGDWNEILWIEGEGWTAWQDGNFDRQAYLHSLESLTASPLVIDTTTATIKYEYYSFQGFASLFYELVCFYEFLSGLVGHMLSK